MNGSNERNRRPRKKSREKTVIARLRMRAGITQREVAEKLGTTERTVRRWEATGLPPDSHGHSTAPLRTAIEKLFEALLADTPVPLGEETRKEIHFENVRYLAGENPRTKRDNTKP